MPLKVTQTDVSATTWPFVNAMTMLDDVLGPETATAVPPIVTVGETLDKKNPTG